jgi:hypothetical protein
MKRGLSRAEALRLVFYRARGVVRVESDPLYNVDHSLDRQGTHVFAQRGFVYLRPGVLMALEVSEEKE